MSELHTAAVIADGDLADTNEIPVRLAGTAGLLKLTLAKVKKYLFNSTSIKFDVTGATDGQALVYDLADDKFVPGSVASGGGGGSMGWYASLTWNGDGTWTGHNIASATSMESGRYLRIAFTTDAPDAGYSAVSSSHFGPYSGDSNFPAMGEYRNGVKNAHGCDLNWAENAQTAGFLAAPTTIFFFHRDTFVSGASMSGGLVKLDQQVLTAAAASITFAGISPAYQDLFVVLTGRGDKAAAFAANWLQFNNDSGGNYDYQTTGTNNVGSIAGASAGDTRIFTGWLPAATGPANQAGSCLIDIPNYANTTFFKEAFSKGGLRKGGTVGDLFNVDVWGDWRNVAAINRIDLTPDGGNFVVGTKAVLYARG